MQHLIGKFQAVYEVPAVCCAQSACCKPQRLLTYPAIGPLCSALLWSAPPSIFGYYSLTTHRFAAWCKRVFGIERPLTPPRGLLFNQWHYKYAGNIIVSVALQLLHNSS